MLALLVQLAAPFTPMPAAGGRSPAALRLAVALWGDSAFCFGEPHKAHEKQIPAAHHACPVCRFLAQAANLLPPAPGPLLARPQAPGRVVALRPPAAEAWRAVSSTQPRAPPGRLTRLA